MKNLNKMRVIRVIPIFYPMVTGPANQAFHISRGLENNNISSPILTTFFGVKDVKSIEKFENVRCLRFKSLINIYQYSITPELIRFLLKTKYDLIHAHSYRNFQSDIAFMVSKLKKIPFIINPHGSAVGFLILKKWQVFKSPYRLYDILTLKNVLKKADVVIAASKQEFNELKEFKVDERKIRIIPAGINIKFFKKNARVKLNKKIKLLFVGRISRDRRVELLLKAFALIYNKYKNLELWIVGGEERRSYTQRLGYVGELKNLCKKLHIDQYVHFTGFLSKDALRNYYINSNIFIYTSDYENFGQTILEAASAGLPLICSDVGVAKDIIEDGKSGFLIQSNPRDIAEKIEYLIVNEKERIAFGKRIQNLVEKKYAWKNIVKQYIKLYDNILLNS